MAETGFRSFTTTVDKTNHVLNNIEQQYGMSKEHRNISYAALRAVIHTLRDRLTVEEAAELGAQLPMLIRGIYYEGWVPTRAPVKMDREEFLARVQREFNFRADGGIELLVQRVLQALRDHITEGEWEDVKSSVPRDLASVFP
ncbi:DUF2267 domain-containing protein [Actinopolymorpha singaporensis]|uniref:Uncharacterized conserved protein, DUF2267 family n=1 Tax=Actinopolymorpha singaporensis TaxID=117157 RepID=A0A1H1UL58_9ACTN|nr:DUF2267 domain-containing protein [Actinopolymorpha singaporensis]SDS73060.1 Uncharacterized conserved protein, DUF2267 family [Actinopolymorpha singaporensis]